jgi:hypothetical protein
MSSHKSSLLVALLCLPLAWLSAGSSVAQGANGDASDKNANPDLVITEDSQIAPQGRIGKAVVGSCKTADPLWQGYIALKNIGGAPVKVEGRHERLATTGGQEEELAPHVRVYVPNHIELQGEARLSHDLKPFGQELLKVSIGQDAPKCRNYDAPPVFDERLSGQPGPIYRSEERERKGPADPLARRIKRIQAVLIDKGFPLSSGPDGDYGPETIRALIAFFKQRHQAPPPHFRQRPPRPETVHLLLEALGIGLEPPPPPPPPRSAGGDECIKGINLVPVYVEIDPLREIDGEDRSNNRVQFTVAIDCSNVAR